MGNFSQLLYRQRRNENGTLQIMGIRLERAYKSPDFDENGVPVLLANQEHVIRLFGDAFVPDMTVTFTAEPGKYGDGCLLPISKGFNVSKCFQKK